MAMPLADDDLPVTLEPEVIAMTKTHVDIEDTLLAQAMQVLGTSTKKETITRALRQVVEDAAQWEALQAEIARGESGCYSVLLTDPDIPWDRS